MILVSSLLVAFASDDELPALDRCLAQWEGHPFGEAPEVRILSPSVRLLGMGSRELIDTPSQDPELVIVRPSVSVLSKTTLSLHNPNGWYCIDTPVGVLSRVVIDAHCTAHLADAHRGRSVGGRHEAGGVAVFGALDVEQTCAVDALPPVESEAVPVGALPR